MLTIGDNEKRELSVFIYGLFFILNFFMNIVSPIPSSNLLIVNIGEIPLKKQDEKNLEEYIKTHHYQ